MIERERGFSKTLIDMVNPYTWVMAARNKAFDLGLLKSRKPDMPTICIGNITVGGTGKTPHTEYLIRVLKKKFRTAVLSRGYGRESKGYIKAAPMATMSQIGDEPFQIKNKFHDIDVAVCEKRVKGIELLAAERPAPQVILLDDAFQHRYVKAGLNILLIDSKRPLWQDCVLPFGRMRESLTGIKRADVVIITKCEGLTLDQKRWCCEYLDNMKNGIPVFFSAVRYGEAYPMFGTGKNAPIPIEEGTEVLLVTGIAKPEPLKEEIESRGAHTELIRYADHHNFTEGNIAGITGKFRSMKGEKKIIVTTEKDATRLLSRADIPADIKERIYVMPIEIKILDGDERMFNQIIIDYVTENSRNR